MIDPDIACDSDYGNPVVARTPRRRCRDISIGQLVLLLVVVNKTSEWAIPPLSILQGTDPQQLCSWHPADSMGIHSCFKFRPALLLVERCRTQTTTRTVNSWVHPVSLCGSGSFSPLSTCFAKQSRHHGHCAVVACMHVWPSNKIFCCSDACAAHHWPVALATHAHFLP